MRRGRGRYRYGCNTNQTHSIHYSDMSNLSVPAINEDILADKKLQIIAMCKEFLKEKFVRCDCKEIFLALV